MTTYVILCMHAVLRSMKKSIPNHLAIPLMHILDITQLTHGGDTS